MPSPSYVQQAARQLRIPEGAKVAGVMLSRDGSAIRDTLNKPLVNGSRGGLPDVDNRATLASRYVAGVGTPRWNKLDVAISHVEGHTAALMRIRADPSEVVLVVTRDPCPGEYGCDKTLAGQIPAGSRLHVYVTQPDGQPAYFGTHTGTGEGVRK